MEDGEQLTREHLASRYGVEAEFVRVKTLAKIMGLAPATIYTHIRQDSLPIPYRHVGGAPMVRVDHLLRWMNEGGSAFVIDASVTKVATPGSDSQGSQLMDPVQAAIDRAMAKVGQSRARRARRP